MRSASASGRAAAPSTPTNGDDGRARRIARRVGCPLGEAFRARFANPYAVIHRADIHRTLLEGAQRAAERIEVLTRRGSPASSRTTVACRRRQRRRPSPRRRADRRRRRQVGRARASRRRHGARVGARRLSRGRRQGRHPGRPALERGEHLGRAQLPPRPLPAARRRAVQRRRHLPQPPARGMGRAEGSPRRSTATSAASARARAS